MTERSHKDIEIEEVRRMPLDVQAQIRRVWSDEDVAAMSQEERERLSIGIILISADIADAMASGTFDSRENAHISRRSPYRREGMA